MSDEADNFFKSLHQNQIARHDQLGNCLDSVVTLLSLTGGLLGYLWMNHTSVEHFSYIFFKMICSISALLFCSCIYFLFKVYKAPQFIDLSPASNWLDHYRNLKLQYNNHSQQNTYSSAIEEFKNDIMERYANTATHNQDANDKMGYAIENARWCVLASFCCAIIAIPLFLFMKNQL